MKKVKRALTLIALGVSSIVHAQWQPTNLTQFNFLTVTGTESFKGELYATVFNGSGADFYQLDPGNSSWTIKTISGVNEFPAAMVTAGSTLYLTSTSLGYGNLYKSTDATNFMLDTVGLPKSISGIELPIGIQYFAGKVLLNLGSSGYWIKDTSAVAWQQIDPVTSLNGGSDPVCYYGDTLYAHDNSGANIFYVSGDFGQTWTARSTNLPAFFVGDMLISNQTSGRLYMAGGESNGNSYGVYISDDNGNTWSMANLSSFIGTDVNNGQQEVTAMYASGGNIFIALENDLANTAPDVISSNSGITNMSYDTLGLISDPAGTIHGARFVLHNGSMAMALNVRDVYLNGISTNVNNLATLTEIELLPNPVKSNLTVHSSVTIREIQIYDLSGRLLYISNPSQKTVLLQMDKYEQGVYLVQLQFADKTWETRKIVKQ